MKVKVNPNACIGCGACAAVCPEVFELTDDGIAKEKEEIVKEEDKDGAIEASEGCPTSAIEVKED